MRYKLILIGMLFLSCSSTITKNEINKHIQIPETWVEKISSTNTKNTIWWNEFEDNKLKEVILEAYENNRTLQIASANVIAASSQAKIAGAPLLPQASLSLDTQKRKQNFIDFPIPGSDGAVLSNTNTNFGASLNISWEIDLWQKLSAEHAGAIANVQIAEADLKGAKLSLEAQICKAWFSAIESKRQVELAIATLTNLQLSVDQIRTRYEAGLIKSLDLRLALSNLALSKSSVKQRENQAKNSIRQLELLLGKYPSTELQISEYLPEYSNDIPSVLPAELISRRSDLVRAERTLAAANAGIKSAKGRLYPQISLTGAKGSSSQEINNLLDGDFGIWNVGANILQPIFQRGRLKEGVKLAEQNSEIAFNQFIQSALTAFTEVENAISNENYLKEREELIESAVEQAIAARTLAEDQYLKGLINFITMLEAQRSAYENESQLLTVTREKLTARVDLYLAIGGGFKKDLIDSKSESEAMNE